MKRQFSFFMKKKLFKKRCEKDKIPKKRKIKSRNENKIHFKIPFQQLRNYQKIKNFKVEKKAFLLFFN